MKKSLTEVLGRDSCVQSIMIQTTLRTNKNDSTQKIVSEFGLRKNKNRYIQSQFQTHFPTFHIAERLAKNVFRKLARVHHFLSLFLKLMIITFSYPRIAIAFVRWLSKISPKSLGFRTWETRRYFGRSAKTHCVMLTKSGDVLCVSFLLTIKTAHDANCVPAQNRWVDVEKITTSIPLRLPSKVCDAQTARRQLWSGESMSILVGYAWLLNTTFLNGSAI